MPTLVDANDNYVPLQRHPDPPAVNFAPASRQVLQYFGASPTADGLIPDDPTSDAIAFKNGGPLVGWDKTNQVWYS